MHAPHATQISPDAEREMRIGAQAPLPHQAPPATGSNEPLALNPVVGEARRDHPREEQARAGMQQPSSRSAHTPVTRGRMAVMVGTLLVTSSGKGALPPIHAGEV
jgi:hypothetical protein